MKRLCRLFGVSASGYYAWRNLAARPAVGSALWGGPIGPHFVENVGSSVLHILAVEI